MPITNSAVRGFLCYLTFAGLVSCSKTSTTEETTKVTQAIVPIRSMQLGIGSVEDGIDVTGRTDATRKEHLVAPIAGKILFLKGIEGTAVGAGEELAQIQTKESQAAIEGSRIMLAEAKTSAQKAEMQKTLREAEATQTGVAVRASIGGIIQSRTANQGEYVAENQELFTLLDPSSINFTADVPLTKMDGVRIGTRATIALPLIPGNTFAAHVIAIRTAVDSSGQTAKVVMQFDRQPADASPLVKTGMMGTARITLAQRGHVLLVPKDAVLRNDETNSYTVMTFGSDSISHPVEVELGATSNGMVEIRGAELKEGMNIIVEGQYALPDSSRITIVTIPKAPVNPQ